MTDDNGSGRDPATYGQWGGRQDSRADVISPWSVRGMSAPWTCRSLLWRQTAP